MKIQHCTLFNQLFWYFYFVDLVWVGSPATITARKKTLAVKNFGDFGESIVIRQSFF